MALFLNYGVQGAAHCCLPVRRVGFAQGNGLLVHMPPSITTLGFCQPKWPQPGQICSFYNRQQELALLQLYASRSGQLLLLTGPADSGKTALLRHFEQTTSALTSFIDLRGGNFTTAAAFAAALKQSWKVSLKAKVSACLALQIPITIDLEPELAGIEQASGLTELLDSLYSFMFRSKNQNLFQQVLGTPTGTPTLIIDEANELHHWVKDAEPDLRALLNFLVKVTKQDRLANVIMASSEDFFHSWLFSNIGKNRFQTGVVGDFSDAEARDFLKQEYEITVPDNLWSLIYNTIGGRALLLTELGQLFSSTTPLGLDLQEIWVAFYEDFMSSEIYFHKKALNPHLVTGGKDSWTADQYLSILRIICDSKGGVAHYETLGKRFGFEAVDGLICYNFLHYRPYRTSAWAKDLRWYEGEWPIVMPCSLLSYHAMGFILRETEAKKQNIV